MATSTRAQAAAVADIAGLDRLELGQTPSAAAPGRIVRKARRGQDEMIEAVERLGQGRQVSLANHRNQLGQLRRRPESPNQADCFHRR